MNKLERIQEMEKQIHELKKQIEAEQVKKWPQEGDVVWWLATEGSIGTARFTNDSSDLERLARGYFFKTREEAVEADRKRVAYVAYIRAVEKWNDGWKPDWSFHDERKYYLFVNHTNFGGQVDCYCSTYAQLKDDSEYFPAKVWKNEMARAELKRLYAEWKGVE